MSNDKTGADLIVEKLSENKSQIESMTENVVNEFRSVGDKITLAFSEAKSKEAQEEIKSLKDQIANKDNKIAALSSSGGVSVVAKEAEEKSLALIASKLHKGSTVDLSSEEYKSIARFSDVTSVGYSNPSIMVNEEINTNAQPLVTILNDIDILPAVADNEKTISWKGYDESLVDILEANENDPATLSKLARNSLIELGQRKVKASMAFSDDVIIASMNGSKLQVLRRNFDALERQYDRKLAANVYQDVINNALAGVSDTIGGSVVGATRYESTSSEAPADAQAREDLRLFPSSLKIQYSTNGTLYVSRKFLNAIFSKEASDGHMVNEQFEFSNGIRFYVTPELYIPVRVFEHAQIGTYKSLADGSTNITTDYVKGGENTGKLLAFVGDMRQSYKMIPSSFGYMDVDRSAKSILSDGFCLGGKVSYAAQGVVLKEGIKVFYSK